MSSMESEKVLKKGKKYNLVKICYSDYNYDKNFKFYELRNKKTGIPMGNKLYSNKKDALKLLK